MIISKLSVYLSFCVSFYYPKVILSKDKQICLIFYVVQANTAARSGVYFAVIDYKFVHTRVANDKHFPSAISGNIHVF